MKKLLKEPLIHFLGGALLVFAFFWATGTNRDPADYTISIAESDIGRLKAGWIQNFRRPPKQKELDGLIDQEIAEEIYYREALRLGMDRNDAVIRRRMFTKMRFLNTEEAAENEPSDSELKDWMAQNPEKYTLDAVYDLQQIYLGQAGDIDDKRVSQLLRELNDGAAKSSDMAKPISLPSQLSKADTATIARQFGDQFANSLSGLDTGIWAGPIPSGFGIHLVKINTKAAGKAASLDDVRQQVTNDWRAAQNLEAETKALEKYRAQYDIQVAGRE